MIEYRKDGSVLLTDEKDPSHTQVITKGSTSAQIEAAIVAFDPGPASALPDGASFRVADFLAAMVAEGLCAQAKATNVLNRLRR